MRHRMFRADIRRLRGQRRLRISRDRVRGLGAATSGGREYVLDDSGRGSHLPHDSDHGSLGPLPCPRGSGSSDPRRAASGVGGRLEAGRVQEGRLPEEGHPVPRPSCFGGEPERTGNDLRFDRVELREFCTQYPDEHRHRPARPRLDQRQQRVAVHPRWRLYRPSQRDSVARSDSRVDRRHQWRHPECHDRLYGRGNSEQRVRPSKQRLRCGEHGPAHGRGLRLLHFHYRAHCSRHGIQHGPRQLHLRGSRGDGARYSGIGDHPTGLR